VVERLVVGRLPFVAGTAECSHSNQQESASACLGRCTGAPIVHPPLGPALEGRLAERADPSSSALSLIGAIGKSGRSRIGHHHQIVSNARTGRAMGECVLARGWGEEGRERREERGGTTRCWTGQVDGQWSRRLVTTLPYYNRLREGGHQARSLWLACQLLCTAGGHGFCW
jgi:hypothetical protein